MNRANLLMGGADCRAVFGGYVAATAGGTGDATEYNGAWVSRKDAAFGLARSAKLLIIADTTLTAAQTLTAIANIQVASDGSGTGAADFGTAMTSRTVRSTTGGAVVELDFNLIDADGEYVRAQVTPELSNANTDTARLMLVWLFFGHPRGPASGSVV